MKRMLAFYLTVMKISILEHWLNFYHLRRSKS